MAVETGAGLNFITTALTSPRLAYSLRNGGGQSIWRMRIPDGNAKAEPPIRMFASTKRSLPSNIPPTEKGSV